MGLNIKKSLYFDTYTRSDKSITLLCLAKATETVRRSGVSGKIDIATELVNTLNSHKTASAIYGRTVGAGEYDGSLNRFNSFYTQGLEFGIWKITKSNYQLTNLAMKLQDGSITPTMYISIVMFNYIQLIYEDSSSEYMLRNLLEESIKLARSNSNELKKTDIIDSDIFISKTFYNSLEEKRKERVKGYASLLFNILSETIYFERIDRNTIKLIGTNNQIDELLKALENTKINELAQEDIADFENQSIYAEYITRVPEVLINYIKHYYTTINTDEISNLKEDEITVSPVITLQLDTDKPTMVNIPYIYTGKSRKTDFVEKSKRQAKIGKLAEKIVYDAEVERINSIDPTKVSEVKWISEEFGDGKGYDIESLDIDPIGNITKKYIEVKATTCGKSTPIDVTRNEVACSKTYSDNYIVYRLYDFKVDESLFNYYTIEGDLEKNNLVATSYKLYL